MVARPRHHGRTARRKPRPPPPHGPLRTRCAPQGPRAGEAPRRGTRDQSGPQAHGRPVDGDLPHRHREPEAQAPVAGRLLVQDPQRHHPRRRKAPHRQARPRAPGADVPSDARRRTRPVTRGQGAPHPVAGPEDCPPPPDDRRERRHPRGPAQHRRDRDEPVLPGRGEGIPRNGGATPHVHAVDRRDRHGFPAGRDPEAALAVRRPRSRAVSTPAGSSNGSPGGMAAATRTPAEPVGTASSPARPTAPCTRATSEAAPSPALRPA